MSRYVRIRPFARQAMMRSMRIHITSVPVDDQDKALRFYTEVLGFEKQNDIPMGEYRWLTVVPCDGPRDVELLLEPMAFAPARTYQKALFDAGIPWTSFASTDIQKEYQKLLAGGVVFRSEPAQMGPVWLAMFEDTCGNLIQLVQA